MNADYQMLRTFADSWGLLAMLLFFAAAAVWVLRPSARKAHEDAASIPFKESE
ncbi:MAG: cbb3-type cytochrome c oxidase subunit 3 [Rhizobiales bacterium]|nr:cbb3-type cytochrome c oxidase subunit 3 [Hyphomicrobiales bacterium]